VVRPTPQLEHELWPAATWYAPTAHAVQALSPEAA